MHHNHHHITLIPGDGVGPEVISSAMRCIRAAGVYMHWDVQQIKNGKVTDEVLDSIRRNKVCLKGPITTPVGSGFRSANVALRQSLDLYANVRPVKTWPGVTSRYKDVDLVVIRENTEDLYAGIEYEHRTTDAKKLIRFIKQTTGHELRVDTGFSIKAISHHATKRITEFAVDYARQNNRKKITIVHKANIMKYTDGKFLKTAMYAAKRRKWSKIEDRIVDNMCMQLVEDPTQFDMLLCPNLYGDILSDLCSGLAGGIGLAPSANIGSKCAIFEPVHGSAPKYTGHHKVNPSAAILAATMLLRHIGEEKAARRIEHALAAVLKEGKHVTYDLSGKSDNREMTNAIIMKMMK